MVFFTSSGFERKYAVLGNSVDKLNIVTLNWNLVLWLIQICRIQWSCSFFSFFNINTLFAQIWSKKSKFSVCGNLIPRAIQIFRAQWWFSLFPFLIRNILFRQNLVKKIKIVHLSWNLVPTLIWICIDQGWFSNFSFPQETPFLHRFGPKMKVGRLSWNLVPAVIFIIFWHFLMVEEIFLPLQGKRSVIISNKLVYKRYPTSFQRS